MKINVFLLFILTIGALLIFIGCDSKLTDPEENNYQISSWIAYSNWTQASPPTSSDSALHFYSQIGEITWYNPFDQVLITDIWPTRDVNAQIGRTIDVLTLKFDPNLDSVYSWNGIMRTYPENEPALTDSGNIEIWIKGDIGTVHIDLGRISEDWWLLDSNHLGQPSWGYLNTEDKNYNGILEDGEDTGVDGIIYNRQPIEWPDDRWRQPDRSLSNYYGINGTEGNIQVSGQSPDTEDINKNGILDLSNEYFEYEFSLDKSNPDTTLLDTLTQTGWGHYKIPLNNPSKIVGIPSWLDIEFVRIWIDDVSVNSANIYIAEIKITE